MWTGRMKVNALLEYNHRAPGRNAGNSEGYSHKPFGSEKISIKTLP